MILKRRKNKPKLSGEEGQAIIEFLIVTTMILTLIFLFVALSWGIAYGHFVHYATFMASRAYLSSDDTKEDQYEAAVSVLRSTVKTARGRDILPMIAKARTGDDRDVKGEEPVPGAALGAHSEMVGNENSRRYSWAEGVQYNFGLRAFLLPLSSVVAGGKGKTITPGTQNEPTKAVEWQGFIPFTSDSFLGREPTTAECYQEMKNLTSKGIGRADGADFLEDNGC